MREPNSGMLGYFFFLGGVKQMVILLKSISDCQFPESEVVLCIFLPAVCDAVLCLPERKEFPDQRVLVLADSLQGG